MSALSCSLLAPGDHRDVKAVAHDRFQSPRARKRAQALLLLHEGLDEEIVHCRTGMTLEQQQQMTERLQNHGLSAAIFSSPRRDDQKRYNNKEIALFLASCLKRRPPQGSMSWKLPQLTDEVRANVEAAEAVSKETVRAILRNELKIHSIRAVDPFWMQQIRRSA